MFIALGKPFVKSEVIFSLEIITMYTVCTSVVQGPEITSLGTSALVRAGSLVSSLMG